MSTSLILPTHDLLGRLFQTLDDANDQTRTSGGYHAYESADAYRIDIPLPGYKKSELSVSVEKGTLTISASPASDGRHFGSAEFSRRFRVPSHVDPAGVDAEYADGVLSIRLPKTVASVRRSVDIR